MTLEKRSTDLTVIFLSLFALVGGILGFALDYRNWLLPVGSIFVGLILIFEVGIKLIAPLHSIKKLTGLQYVSLLIAVLLVINGILNIPVIGIQLEILGTINSVLLILGGILILAEWFSQKR